MEYIICADGGGTKTEAIAYNHMGEELRKYVAGYSNLTQNKEAALSNILESIEKCKVNEGNLIGIYLGIAGAEVGENRRIIKEAVEDKFNITPEIYNDAEIALYALLKGHDGILAISGTGSICIGICNGISAKSGGWGYLLGDEGSGYNLAIEAFKKMIYDYEEGFKLSALSAAILDKLGIKSVEEIESFIYSSTKDQIASIVPVIAKMADAGESNAIELLKDSGYQIAKTTERVWKKLGKPKDINIALKGSIITKIRIVREAYDDYIKKLIKDVKIIDDDVSSAKGGYYLALKEWEGSSYEY